MFLNKIVIHSRMQSGCLIYIYNKLHILILIKQSFYEYSIIYNFTFDFFVQVVDNYL